MDEKTRNLIVIGAQVQRGGMNAMQRFVGQSFGSIPDDGNSHAGEKLIQGAGAFSLVGNTGADSGECSPGKGCC